MSRPLKPQASSPKATTPAAPKRQARKTADRGNTLTRERLNEQMRAFRAAGGKVEVLGTTRSLQNIDLPASPQASSAPAATPKKRSR